MVVFGEIGGVKWWPLVIVVLWKTNREDKDEREDRDEKMERDIYDEERENENKITIYILQLLSVLSQI